MNEDIKKISIETSLKKKKSNKSKTDTIKKLAQNPNELRNFIQDKMKNIEKKDIKSWVVPSFLKPTIKENPHKIESIIKDIQSHRKTNQLLSKKQPRKEKKVSYDINLKSDFKPTVETTEKDQKIKIKRGGGRVKTRKEGRLYTKKELKDLHTSLIKLYNEGNNKKLNSILKKLTKNQCNQILSYTKIIKKSWTNAPLPLLRFLVYQTISYQKIRYKIS